MRPRSLLGVCVGGCLLVVACGSGPQHAPLVDDGTTSKPGGGGGPAPSGPQSIDASLSWPGFAEGSTEASSVALAAYHDPDGSKGIHALLITEVSFSCAACLTETHDIVKNLAGPWKTLGVRVVQLVIDDATGHLGKSTIDSAKAWRDATGTTFAVGADPSFSFSHDGSNPMPQVLIVNPRNLAVVSRVEGYDPSETSLDVTALAHANGAN